ncbi:hypothetical protein ACPPVU_21585 [Mucilaginibacter sp. McL0603]|uniref:hypothetical protein n=1 Tax=Mucilaginibacter sp. McL0603 TaxID=3415670 RepID=UPI003CF6187A
MKNPPLFIAALFVLSGLFSCKKSNQSPAVPTSIVGKWQLVNDSLVSGVGPIVTGSNYIGKNGDYFDFGTNNKVYIKEGANLDSSAYQVMSDSTVVLNVYAERYNAISPVSKMTFVPDGVTLRSPSVFVANPGSYYLRIINLRK